jgi:alpha-D-xyloside xylohydrolase
MHSLFGLLYQKTILEPFIRQNIRTLSEVRSSYAPAAHLPFVLYSDLYAHRDFIRGVVNAGFTGLLWSPEVRQCSSVEDLIRRLQSVVLSPQALVNSWMIPHPPWWQFEQEKNRGNVPLRGWKKVESMVREIFELRMSLLPYLYGAFARYHDEGTPPFRALVMDHPHDPEALNIDDQFLIGDSFLAAPMFAGEKKRRVYLPAGTWFDFFSHRKYEGGKWHEIEPELRHIPLFVMDNTLLPLAKPVPHVAAEMTFEVTVRVYGADPRPFDLYVDDGVSFDYERGRRGWLKLSWSGGEGKAEPSGEMDRELYKIVGWTRPA